MRKTIFLVLTLTWGIMPLFYPAVELQGAAEEPHVVEWRSPFRVTAVEGVAWECHGDRTVPDVLLEIWKPPDSSSVQSTRTNSKGKFVFEGLPEGEYRFKASRDGYHTFRGSIVLSDNADITNKVIFRMYASHHDPVDPSCYDTGRFTWEHGGDLRGFSVSLLEHIIYEIEKPIEVRNVHGTILHNAYEEPVPMEDVLFEIRGPNRSDKIRATLTDRNGHFKIRGVPKGRYKFKATLVGFQSVVGTVIVSKKADKKKRITLRMEVGV